MKKIITIEIPTLKTNIVKSLSEEIKQDAIEKTYHLKNNKLIIKKHNEVLDELEKFLAENLPNFKLKKEYIEMELDQKTCKTNGFVGFRSKSIKCNFMSRDAEFGFFMFPQGTYNHKFGMYILNGEIALNLITKYEQTKINIEEIGLIFEKGRSTLKEMMLKDFSFA